MNGVKWKISDILYVGFVYEDNVINDIIVIIHTRSYLSTGMVRTGQSTEYYSWFVPYHQEVLRAHQSHFCLRAIAEDRGFQSDVSDIQTETEQICQAERNTVTGKV